MSVSTEQILQSIKQLSDLGYHDFQIDSILNDTVNTKRVDSLTPEQRKELFEVLEDYIKFALKCRTAR